MAASTLVPPVLAEPPRVGRVTVVCEDVYSAEEGEHGWVYRAASALHVRTRESTIRDFLLFKEGDPFDPEKLAQTERTLRLQPFLKSATVRAVSEAGTDGTVDVLVETQDTWTTEPRIAVKRSGGFTGWGFSLVERNVLGRGHKLKLSYDETPDRIRRFLEFVDPHFLSAYWNAALVLAANSDGNEAFVSLTHPFTSIDAPWSVAGNYASATFRDRIYDAGLPVSEFEVDAEDWRLEYGRKLAASSTRGARLAGGVSRQDRRFMRIPESDLVPTDREFTYLYLRGELVGTRVVKMNFVNRDTRFEDFELAPRLTFSLGVSPAGLGPERTTELVEVGAHGGFELGERTILQSRLQASTRLGAENLNTLVTAELRGFHRFGGGLPQTLVLRVEGTAGWDLDPDLQFFADGDSGLRGYPLYAFSGTRRLLMNLEHRISAGREFFQFLSPGAAAFVDVGGAVPAERHPTWSDLKADVGLGLRFGLPRAAEQVVLRLDVAWPLAPAPDGTQSPLVSFSSSQAF